MDTTLYLNRLGLAEAPSVSLEGLNQLIHAHQTHIPFENLNVCDLHCGVRLEEDVLFDKIVLHRRGGYCFELNGLFCELLRALGFDAFTVFVRLRNGGYDPRINHRAILVRLDGMLHYVDVGKGDFEPGIALPLDGRSYQVDGDCYWIVPDEEDEEWAWMFCQKADETESKPSLCFGLVARETPEFQPHSDALSESPDSPFWKRRMITLRMENGFRYLRGTSYSEVEDGVTTVQKEIPDEDSLALIKEKFGIVL